MRLPSFCAIFLFFWVAVLDVEVLGQEVANIVGGSPAQRGRFPYMVGLMYNIGIIPQCGGVLVAPNVVLSAGHCAGAVKALIGCYNVFETEKEENCEEITISQEIIHPDFQQADLGSVRRDFMVLILSENSSNRPISFVQGVNLELNAGLDFTIIGWGKTEDELLAEFPSVLREVEVDVVDFDECNDIFLDDSGKDLIRNGMFCGARPGKDSCQGDSGGPALIRCDRLEEDILIGFVSWGFSCADPVFPGVYAEFSFAFDFFNDIVEEQGHSLSAIESLDDHCLVGGTKGPTVSPTPPTQAPTLPADWTCNNFEFHGLDGCHCNCGAVDPDCSDPLSTSRIFNCKAGEVCNAAGLCSLATESPSSSPSFKSTQSPTSNPNEDQPNLEADNGLSGAVVGALVGSLIVIFAAAGVLISKIRKPKPVVEESLAPAEKTNLPPKNVVASNEDKGLNSEKLKPMDV